MQYLLSIVLITVGAACQKTDPDYCPRHPDDLENCPSDAPDAGGCMNDSQCSGATSICDTGRMTCVQCTVAEDSACMGTTPVCSADVCAACTAHAQCGSNACLPDGSCGDDTNVAYVDPAGTDNASCTKAMPCTKVVKALATNRPFVKFHGATDEAVNLTSRNVTLLADPGASLTRSSNGNILVIDGTSNVSVYDLSINGASGTGAGISMPTGGTQVVSLTRATLSMNNGSSPAVSAQGGSLTISQSTISNNTAGGISVMNAAFDVVGNVFFNNGGNLATVGGIAISAGQSASNRLEFNSFNKNTTMDGIAAGIQCIAGTFTAKNNVMSGNGTVTELDQAGGTCMHTYSIARPGTVPAGTGNSSNDPMFANINTGDLHISATSPARHAADPSSDLTGIAAHDIDGDPRVAPADIGADQVKP